MSSYPATIFSPRERENWPGIIYDPDKKTLGFAEDFNYSDDEIVAIESVLGCNPVTTGDITYYVDCDNGDDDNPGTEAEPFKTIQHAIDVLPKCVRHSITIRLKSSQNYAEAVLITGFYGPGELRIFGLSGSANDVLITKDDDIFYCLYNNLSRLDFRFFSGRVTANGKHIFRTYLSPHINIQNVKGGDNGNTGTRFLYAGRLDHVNVINCSDIDADKCAYGLYADYGSIVGVYNSALGDINYKVDDGGMITDGSSFKP